jgi:NTP pyrophosphatase (non-canonical NTP hydrolase)
MITIRELQGHAREWRAAQGWPDNTVEQQALFLVTEVGELACEVLRLARNDGSVDIAEVKEKLGLEVYDVVWNVCDLANRLHIDLDQAFTQKAAVNRARKW